MLCDATRLAACNDLVGCTKRRARARARRALLTHDRGAATEAAATQQGLPADSRERPLMSRSLHLLPKSFVGCNETSAANSELVVLPHMYGAHAQHSSATLPVALLQLERVYSACASVLHTSAMYT